MNRTDNSGNWETYISMYENNIPASTTVRMELLEIAPIKRYPIVVETGLTYIPGENDGFPDIQTLEMLHELSSKLENLFRRNGEHLFVGSFMSNGDRFEYYYLTEISDIENQLHSFYKKNYPNQEYEINVVKDVKWTYYKDFLYPNDETLAYISDEKLIKRIEDSGDNTSQSRKINHWLFFKSERKMNKCKTILTKEGFTLESETVNKKNNLPYELKISKQGPIIIDSIFNTTCFLRETTEKYKGRYDGWETSIVK